MMKIKICMMSHMIFTPPPYHKLSDFLRLPQSVTYLWTAPTAIAGILLLHCQTA